MTRVEVKFLFEYSTRQLTSERRKRVRCRVEHDKRNSISTSNRVLFCLSYKHNSPLLTRKVNFILINENKRIDNPQRKIVNCVGAKAQEEKMCRNTSKTNNGCNFQYTKFSFIVQVLTDRRNISSKRPKSACGKSPSCRISFSAARKAITKAIENITFGFSSRVLVFFPYGFFNHQSH